MHLVDLILLELKYLVQYPLFPLRLRSSIIPEIGIRIKMIEKYEMEASWPMIINGCSTGWPPIQVKISRLATRIQYKICVIGRNIRLRCFEV